MSKILVSLKMNKKYCSGFFSGEKIVGKTKQAHFFIIDYSISLKVELLKFFWCQNIFLEQNEQKILCWNFPTKKVGKTRHTF